MNPDTMMKKARAANFIENNGKVLRGINMLRTDFNKLSSITAFVPRERIEIRKGGLWSKMIKLLFPWYVFVDIDYDAEMFHKINPISGVIRFLGLPTPLPQREADMILWLANGGEVIEPSPLTVNGDNIICGGFLTGHEDDIKYLNARQKKASVEVRFGGKVHRANIGVEIKKVE